MYTLLLILQSVVCSPLSVRYSTIKIRVAVIILGQGHFLFWGINYTTDMVRGLCPKAFTSITDVKKTFRTVLLHYNDYHLFFILLGIADGSFLIQFKCLVIQHMDS